ncbi:MAG TPA: hypothetical protein VNW26_02105 [Steroidobacteraceae bacterium]|jgi:hypothetical protein|nr:hypothetical protein [Steroidobacteraceae bacterium]
MMLGAGFLNAIPTFDTFRKLIEQNVGYFPDFSFDRVSRSGHRVRAFTDPPSADIRLSEQALARYISITDLLDGTMRRKSAEFASDCLCIVGGAEFLLGNKFQGLALVAHGFRRVLLNRMPTKEIIENVAKRSQDPDDILALISVLLPLAHEIGHLPQAQAYCPKPVMGDEFLETYRINYDRIIGFTGEFDYTTSFFDRTSPINLETLRQEVAADYFATCAISALFGETKVGQPYPIQAMTFGLLMFPIAMAFESLCLGQGRSARSIQETTLAMQCRKSLLLDSVRGCIKSFFAERSDREELFKIIDDETGRISAEFYGLQQWVWAGMRTYSEFTNKVALWSNDEVVAYALQSTPNVQQQIEIAHYISLLLDESGVYPLLKENADSMREYSNALLTFDTIIVEQDGIRLIRQDKG